MKQTITKSDKSIKTLNRLVSNGFYKGFVESEKFELKRNNHVNNFRIIGILNDHEKFEVKFDFDSQMCNSIKILLILGIIFSVVSVFKENYIIPTLFSVIVLISLIAFKLKEKKEIELFTNKFLEIHKTEYD